MDPNVASYWSFDTEPRIYIDGVEGIYATARFTVLGTPREELPEETYDDEAPEEKNDWYDIITADNVEEERVLG